MRHVAAGGSRWWLRDPALVPVAEAALATMARLAPGRTDGVEVYKHNRRKLVFRLPVDVPGPVIVKAFFLDSRRRRLQYYLGRFRFMEHEAANLATAAARGLHVPEVYGYGRLYGPLGIVAGTVVLLQYLHDRVPLGVLLRAHAGDPARAGATFMRTLPLFPALQRAHCNHIDVSADNVLLAPDDREATLWLIDFQNARFHDRPSPLVVVSQAAHLAKSCARWITADVRSAWLARVLDLVGVMTDPVRRDLTRAFEYYLRTRLPRRELQKIGRPGAGAYPSRPL